MFKVQQTESFKAWVKVLRDATARIAILRRIERMQAGNFGDAKSVGGGVSELRVDVGQGYRVYYTLRGQQVVVVLVGGDKSSQAKDIKKAQEIAKEI